MELGKLQEALLKPNAEQPSPYQCENQEVPDLSLVINKGACPNRCCGARENPEMLKPKVKPGFGGFMPEFAKQSTPPLTHRQSSLSESIEAMKGKWAPTPSPSKEKRDSSYLEGRPQPKLITDITKYHPPPVAHDADVPHIDGMRQQRQFEGPDRSVIFSRREEEAQICGMIAQFRPIMAYERLKRQLTRDEQARSDACLPPPPTRD